jgi:Protein of unknown function (DUF4236)
MGHFRFRRSFGSKFFRLNVSKTGISTTSGVPGAHVNVPLLDWRGRKRSSMITLGMPGTGLSYRQQVGGGHRGRQPEPSIDASNLVVAGFIVMVILWFFFG